ncbi:cytochrome c oxidase assembly protein, partial [Kytococcus schroeteri]|uniref:cytochrome c oxidase assembly protein n=2 Tax=Kytococcaceae TaxID=2805426 RepID=UPI001EE1D010
EPTNYAVSVMSESQQSPPRPTASPENPAPAVQESARQRAPWAALGAIALLVAVTAVGASWLSGATRQLLLVDAGAFVRWALPVVRALVMTGMVTTVGALGVAAFVVPERRSTHRLALLGRVALVGSLLWGLTSWVLAVLTFSEVLGTPIGAEGFWQQYFAFWWDLGLLVQFQLTGILALVVAALCAWSTGRSGLHWAFWLAIGATLPLAFTGHSGGSLDHDAAVNGYGGHLIGVAVWVGGLLGLALLWSGLGQDRAVAVRRYSVVALCAFVVTGLSGVLNASLRVGWGDLLTTAYGQLLLAKVGLLVVLGVFGAVMRRQVVARLEQAERGAGATEVGEGPAAERAGGLFARLATLELLVMAVAAGLGSALARTPTPVPELTGEAIGDPAVALTGYPRPPALTASSWFTAWQVEWLFTTIGVVAIALYTWGWLRLRRRGDAWPWYRLPLWVFGWLLFLYVVNGAPTVYGRVMFSMHMVMHMTLMMAIPFFLVPAAPVTLAMRTLPARKDRTIGPREWLLGIVHSRYAQFIGHPVVAALLFFVSLVVFYWSPALEIALTTHGGHVAMVAHFLLVGYLFVWTLAGPDPGGVKWPAPLRLVVMLATLAGHAFFGVAMMMGTYLLAPDFFQTIDLPYVKDLVADQQLGGGIAWGIGELPVVVLAIMVGLEWSNSDERESRRYDRKAARDEDAELRAYNEQLSRMGRNPRP